MYRENGSVSVMMVNSKWCQSARATYKLLSVAMFAVFYQQNQHYSLMNTYGYHSTGDNGALVCLLGTTKEPLPSHRRLCWRQFCTYIRTRVELLESNESSESSPRIFVELVTMTIKQQRVPLSSVFSETMAQSLGPEQLCVVFEQTLSPVADVRRNGTQEQSRK